MKKFNKSDFPFETAILCSTEKEWNDVISIMGETGYDRHWERYSMGQGLYKYTHSAFDRSDRDMKGKNVIKAEDFIKMYILDKNNWCVKGPLSKDVIQYINSRATRVGDYGGAYSVFYGLEGGVEKASTKAWATELTEDEVREYIIGDGKKIIGYKSPYDLFGGEAPAGTLFVKTKWNDKFYGWGDNANTTSYSRHLPKEIVERWEPVYSQNSKEIIIGKRDTKVKINSNGKIEFRGEYTEVNLVKALIKDFDIEPRSIGTSWKTQIDKNMRFIKIGCDSEDNRFSIHELELVVKTYEELKNH